MNLGAVVRYEEKLWRVYKLDSHVRTATLIRWGGHLQEVADDDPNVVVVANLDQWPVVTARVKPTAGPLVKLSLTRNGRSRALEPLVDWVPSDLMRAGGSIFMKPELNLRVGEILIAEYANGNATRIVITKRYGSMAQRKAPQSLTKKKGLMEFLDGEDFVE